jgi:hypothetical protein
MRIIRDAGLWSLIEDAKNKRIILYTDTKYCKELCRIFDNIDIVIDYVVTDEQSADCRSVYDVMYEDLNNIMVVVAKEDFVAAKSVLEGIGLKLGINFKNIKRYNKECIDMPYYFDPVCGYNLATNDNKYNGFKVCGNPDNKDCLRIVTMGGSTTDAFLFPFKSWSELLHEKLEENLISNVIFVGGGERIYFVRRVVKINTGWNIVESWYHNQL